MLLDLCIDWFSYCLIQLLVCAILRTFSPLWLKVRLECGKMRGTLKILLTSSHFTTFSAHGLAGLGWAGWAG